MKNKILRHLRLIINLSLNFGLVNGISLYFNCLYGNTKALKVKNIKHPIQLRKKSTDIDTFFQIFLNNEYNFPHTYAPKIIIDAGANVGLFAILMKNKFPDAIIICVEPDVTNYNILKSNMSKYSDIECINAGIWNKNTLLNVYDKYDSGKWGLVVEEDLVNGQIKAITIDEILDIYNINNIDLLKIDIETSERVLFESNYKNWLNKTTTLVVEPHDWLLDGCTQPVINAVVDCFQNYNLIVSGETLVFSKLSLIK